jgi:tRNA dimethylallyltransferase
VGKSSFVYGHLSPEQNYVISADSMQIYRSFDVATATPSPEERERFPHAGVNEKDPSEEYSVREFLDRADRAVEEAHEADRIPLVVGGTGLYLKTFLHGLSEMPPANEAFRERLREEADETSRQAIHERLEDVDPTAAENIHPNDLKRTIRALEIYHETGRTKTELIETQESEGFRDGLEPTIIGLKRPMKELRRRIERRTASMLESGLVEEIRRLRNEWDVSQTVRQAIGYEEGVRYLDDEIDRETLAEEISNNTYQLARKQMTWFRQLPVETWYHPDDERGALIDDYRSNRQQTA